MAGTDKNLKVHFEIEGKKKIRKLEDNITFEKLIDEVKSLFEKQLVNKFKCFCSFFPFAIFCVSTKNSNLLEISV